MWKTRTEWIDLLIYQSLVKKIYRSKTARTMSLFVLCALFSAQLLFLVPYLKSQHSHAVQVLVSSERSRMEAAYAFADIEDLLESSTMLNEQLLGLMVATSQGKPISNAGILPDPRVFEIQTGEWASYERGAVDTVWPISTNYGNVLTMVRINTKSIRHTTMMNSIRTIAFAFLASLAGAIAALWCTTRYYIQPLNSMIAALRASREKSLGKVPDAIEFGESEDLNPLAEEFNSLIDEQRKAARQLKVKQQYLEFAAHNDPLTHLPNRLMFEDTLKKTVADAVKEEGRFAIYLIDLDNFKFFNDQYGHLVGDKMVAEVGNRLRALMRDNDLVARLDGDEFVVIQKAVEDRKSAEEVAQKLMDEATAPFEYRGFTLKVAATVGISCFPQDVHVDQDVEMLGEEIVNNATVALQEAKTNGKNQLQFFNESMRKRLTARIRLEQDLKIALQEEQFEVYYQPKINIETRKVTGAEALVRWKHPTEGFVSPEEFVPVAEEAGMIIDLGEWILRTACRQTHRLQEYGYRGLGVAVNISAVQFTDGNLLPMVSKALQDTNLQPELLELEITESAVMHDPEEVIRSLHELSRFGMQLAIDDFGTGYSSLAYLKRFSVDTLKIDRAFITDISSDSDDVAIVEAVLGLGKHFNMKVVAEGVEDEAQLEFLRTQGCDLAQGYLISKPMCFKDYVAWLKQWPHGIHIDMEKPDLKIASNG